MVWQGMTAKSLRHHYSLCPLYVATAVGAMGAAYYLIRMATKGPDVAWSKNKNPYPWTKIPADHNVKFLSAGRVDFKNLKRNGPDI